MFLSKNGLFSTQDIIGYPGTMGPTEILEPMIHFEFGSLLRDVCIYTCIYIYIIYI